MKLNPNDILKILEENGISLATRVNMKCINGHHFAIKAGEISAPCPECEKFSKEYIAGMIDKRRDKSLRIKDSDDEKLTPSGVYVVKLSRGNEILYKIGISTKSPFERLAKIPYNVETIRMIFTNSCSANFIERALHGIHDDAGFSYIPNIGFTGCSECFSDLLLDEIDEFVNDQELAIQKASKIWLQNI